MKSKTPRLIVAGLLAATLVGLVHLQSDFSGLWILMYPGYLVSALIFSEGVHGDQQFVAIMYSVSFVLYGWVFYVVLGLSSKERAQR